MRVPTVRPPVGGQFPEWHPSNGWGILRRVRTWCLAASTVTVVLKILRPGARFFDANGKNQRLRDAVLSIGDESAPLYAVPPYVDNLMACVIASVVNVVAWHYYKVVE